MKKYNFFDIVFHLFFWMIAAYIFCNLSFIRIHPQHNEYEYYSLIIVIILIYINYFLITPLYLKRNKIISYFIFTLSSIIIATYFEFCFIKNDIILFTSKASINIQNSALKWNLYGIFFRDVLFVGFFTIYRIYRDAIKAYKLLQEKTELEKLQFLTQIEMIKSKINTHFFFNSLSSIYELVMSKSEKAGGIVLNLADLMEYVVKDSENEWVPLDDEIKFIQNYIELERIAHENMNLQFEIIGDTSHQKVPPMIFESFVNNAFKYCNINKGGFIKINVECYIGEILFKCENSVYTVDHPAVKSTGKGLKNTVNRLNLLYKDQYNLDIIEDECTYKINLVLKNN